MNDDVQYMFPNVWYYLANDIVQNLCEYRVKSLLCSPEGQTRSSKLPMSSKVAM
jgi:hypothetical protein